MFFAQYPGDQLAIGKETGRRLGMGTNMYPSSSLLGQDKDASVAALPVDELIEKADGFAGVFPGDFSCIMYFYNAHPFLWPYLGNFVELYWIVLIVIIIIMRVMPKINFP